MKLYLNKASPYARLALVVAHEKGLAESLELHWVDPWASTPDFLAVAPLARVPVLMTDDDIAIADSAAICDYLDAFSKSRALLPALPLRAHTLRKYGLGRGLIELAFGATVEKRFHPEQQPLGERWAGTVARSARHIETLVDQLDAKEPDLGDLCIAVGLGYADFRMPHVTWRGACPKLAEWQDRMNARPAMRATAPE